MKKYILLTALTSLYFISLKGQSLNAPICKLWSSYASDTTRTFPLIVALCDSMFADAGYPVLDTVTDSAEKEELRGLTDGSPYWEYTRWKMFWESRCDVETLKPHDFLRDALQQVGTQQKTTSSDTYCSGGSDLQNDPTKFPMSPRGWKYIGPRNLSTTVSDQHAGRVNDIVVNPSYTNEIYARDEFGGLWKTENANSPDITWRCLSDHLPYVNGMGVLNFYVDFSTTPHQLFCQVGIARGTCFPNITESTPYTVGIFYSSNDGATFSRLDISSIIPDFANEPILDMKYWPGNSGSGDKFLFISTTKKVRRLKINSLTSITSQTLLDISDILSAGENGDDPASRFRGFQQMTFLPSNPNTLFVSTRSNIGFEHFQTTAGLYKINSCSTCSSCSYTFMDNNIVGEVLQGRGSFSSDVTFPSKYGFWRSSSGINNWELITSVSIDGHLKCVPPSGSESSVEMPVSGSFFHSIPYTVNFDLELPPYTSVTVILKDVKKTHSGEADWGYGGFNSMIYVGSGSCTGPTGTCTPTPGVYENSSSSTVPLPISVTVTAPYFVNRLEFGATQLAGYPSSGGGAIKLDNVKVFQPYSDYIWSLASTYTSTSAANNVYCVVEQAFPDPEPPIQKFQKIDGTTTGVFSSYTTPGSQFSISPSNPNYIYQYNFQNSSGGRFARLDLSTATPTTTATPDLTTTSLHDDTRSITAINNAGVDDIYIGTDGGLAKGNYGGPWSSLNGTGLNTLWAIDVGSSEYTGQVGIAASDNGIWLSNPGLRKNWDFYHVGDGAQVKFGKRSQTGKTAFKGSSSNGPFNELAILGNWGIPTISGAAINVNAGLLSKMVSTFGGEFVGNGRPPSPATPYCILSGKLTPISPTFSTITFQDISTHSTFSPDADVAKRKPVRAVAPDLFKDDYLMAYMSGQVYEDGYFAVTTSANTSLPTWTVINNTAGRSFLHLVADPRTLGTTKRLWAGAIGYSSTAGTQSVFVTTNNATTWANMSDGLPKGPINALVYDEQSMYLFAGTDHGVYAFNVAAGACCSTNHWQCFSLNLPSSVVSGLDVNHCTGKLYVSLNGRGAYEADLPPSQNPYGNGPGGPTDNSDINYITTSDTWSGDKNEMRSIYIPSGVTLKLDHCTLNMGANKYIVVAVGGKLEVVNNSVITNSCGSLWGGILAKSNSGASQQFVANQGWVVISNSVIEYAKCGVQDNNGSTTASGGGIIQAYGSTFRNNVRDVTFTDYHNVYGSVLHPNASYFSVCNFVWDRENRLSNLGIAPGIHAKLTTIEGLRFIACNFLNRDTAKSIKGLGTGIDATNAGFTVNASVPLLALPTYSRFCGLTTGIFVKGLGDDPTVYINKVKFDTNSVGINIIKHSKVSTTQCQFKMGNGLPIHLLYAKTPDFLGCKQNIGIMTSNVDAFTIRGNTFSGRQISLYDWSNIGAAVVNCGYYTKNITLNTFDTLNNGVVSLGVNVQSALGGPYLRGLNVTCNTFYDNNTDIHISRQDLTTPGQGVNMLQGDGYSSVAGNTFSTTTGSTNILNNGSTLYYYWDGTHIAEKPTVVSGSSATYVYSVSISKNCNSLPNTDVILTGATAISEKKSTYYNNSAVLSSATANYYTRVDNGSTSGLISYIDTVTNADSLYATLQRISPFVSDTALSEMIDIGLLSYGQEYEVLAANPDALRKNNLLPNVVAYFIEAEANANPPLPKYDSAIVAGAGMTTPRTGIEDSIVNAWKNMDIALFDLLLAYQFPDDSNVSPTDTTWSAFCTDSSSVHFLSDSNLVYLDFDSTENWVQKYSDPTMGYARIMYDYRKGNYSTAQTAFNAINYQSLIGVERQTFDTFAVVWGVLKTAADSGRRFYQLNDLELVNLTITDTPILQTYNAARPLIKIIKTWRDVDPGTVAEWNCDNYGVKPLFDDNKGRFQKKLTKNLFGSIKAYPNPSSGQVIFEYHITMQGVRGDNVTILISNIVGQRVTELKAEGKDGKVKWEAQGLPAGIYLYQASTCDGVIGNGKLVLVR